MSLVHLPSALWMITRMVRISPTSPAEGRGIRQVQSENWLAEVIGRSAREFDIWKDTGERARVIGELLGKGDRGMTMKDKSADIGYTHSRTPAIDRRFHL